MMARATNAANASAAASSIEATASVAAAAQTGAMINMEPVVEVAPTVSPASGLPLYPATVSQIALPRLQGGSTLHVRVDAQDPQSVWINFAAGAP